MVRTLDAMVLYTPNLVLTSGLDGPHTGSMVLYTPNQVLTSGLMVRTLMQWFSHPKPCFDEWPDGPHHGMQWFSTPQTLF